MKVKIELSPTELVELVRNHVEDEGHDLTNKTVIVSFRANGQSSGNVVAEIEITEAPAHVPYFDR